MYERHQFRAHDLKAWIGLCAAQESCCAINGGIVSTTLNTENDEKTITEHDAKLLTQGFRTKYQMVWVIFFLRIPMAYFQFFLRHFFNKLFEPLGKKPKYSTHFCEFDNLCILFRSIQWKTSIKYGAENKFPCRKLPLGPTGN